MKELNLKKEYKTLRELKADVAASMINDTVLQSHSQVREYFKALYGEQFKYEHLYSELVVKKDADVIDRRRKERKCYSVYVWAYYTDPAAHDDYAYIQLITKEYAEML